jgi:hypothetical protein
MELDAHNLACAEAIFVEVLALQLDPAVSTPCGMTRRYGYGVARGPYVQHIEVDAGAKRAEPAPNKSPTTSRPEYIPAALGR